MQKTKLKTMKCPTCGASLKAANGTDAITCVYCGNSIVPVVESTASRNDVTDGFSGVLRVEGIKTSASALAYLEQFWEEYDWDAFVYAQTLSVWEIDKLANSLKASSADDKNTWFVCFKALSVPLTHKVAGCKAILASVIAEYEKDSLEAYSKFDAYKRIAAMIQTQKASIVEKLEKIAINAAKYGASTTEVGGLQAEIDNIKQLTQVEGYDRIESIPQVGAIIEQTNTRILQELAAEGIDAEQTYARAKELLAAKKYVEALDTLLTLKGYADSEDLIEEIDKYYLLDDVLEVTGNLYYFKKEGETLSLYPAQNGQIAAKSIIGNIGKIITNYGDILYFINGESLLIRYNFTTGAKEQIYKFPVSRKFVHAYNRKAYLLANTSGSYSSRKRDLVTLDICTGVFNTVLKDIKSVESFKDNKLVYTITQKEENTDASSYEMNYKTLTNIINVDTMDVVELGTKKVNIVGYIDNYVVYTQNAPNAYNKNLYIKSLNTDEPEKLIEQNIYNFCDIIADKLFYYIGNSANQTLININCDGTGRREWPMYISSVLFEQGGWLYFIRKAGYNSVLCKARLDGSKFSIIAADIEEWIDIKNGYLYYINDESTLVKVRMDGSNLQKLCEKVETVLAVKEDKIVFISEDDMITKRENSLVGLEVKSIYAVDFSGSGKIKLAYDVKRAKEYDENTVYYIASRQIKSTDDQLLAEEQEEKREMLYKLDVVTNQVEKLLDLKIQQKEEEKMSRFMIAMIVMAVGFFFAMIGLASGAVGLGVFGFLTAVIALLFGLVDKYGKTE